MASAAQGGGEVGLLAKKDQVDAVHLSFFPFSGISTMQCDGRPIPLPSLQGIAVLNIPSYAGGTNFWGGTKEDDVRTGVLGGMDPRWVWVIPQVSTTSGPDGAFCLLGLC